MRKFSLYFLLSFYTLCSFGVEAKLHFCCGHLQEVHFFEFESHSNDHSEHANCCHKKHCSSDLQIQLQHTDQHINCIDFIEIQKLAVISTPYIHSIQNESKYSITTNFSNSKEDPPPQRKIYDIFCCRKIDALLLS
jgi:hypothetical protein